MTTRRDIFAILKEDHDQHRDLLTRLEKTHGESDERIKLFRRFTLEVKG